MDFTKFENAGEFQLADAGKYELVLRIEPKKTKDGTKEFLNLDFKIREDVDQACKGVHIFDKAWRDVTEPDWFDTKKLGKLLFTQKNVEGFKANFDDQDELTLYLNGIHLIATVDKVYDDYSAKEVNVIKYLSYEPSVWDKTHPATATAAPADEIKSGNTESLELPEGQDDFPF